jgi:hypothetical protein
MGMGLFWYQLLALAALGICLIACLVHFIRLISLGKPNDFSQPAATTGSAIRYAFAGAMSPAKKESAYLHLPTYTAGLFYHMGTFLSFFLFFFFLAEIYPQGWLAAIILAFLGISSISGIIIFIKRIIKKELKSLSNPDDFISNILVTLFQISTILILFAPTVLQSYSPTVLQSNSPAVLQSYSPIVQLSNCPTVQLSNCPTVQLIYYLTFTFLMLYTPVGKLRHMIYFFAARFHLGFFFGRRGVWPPEAFNSKKNQRTHDFF